MCLHLFIGKIIFGTVCPIPSVGKIIFETVCSHLSVVKIIFWTVCPHISVEKIIFGTMCPIPFRWEDYFWDNVSYTFPLGRLLLGQCVLDLSVRKINIGTVWSHLSVGKISGERAVHLLKEKS